MDIAGGAQAQVAASAGELAAAERLAVALQGQLRESDDALAAAKDDLAAARAEVAAVLCHQRHEDGHEMTGSPARQTGMELALVNVPQPRWWPEVCADTLAWR
jgi:hypothetical protein